MCGITGIMAFNELGRMHMIHLAQATQILAHRGPDFQNTYIEERIGLGHRRLAVIDTSSAGNQPMTDASGRFTIVYNGEIYNYAQLRIFLQNQGVEFQSNSDTEVLLQLFIHKGIPCLQELQGCFAFAIYDSYKKELILARDRLGVNPLLYYHDEDKFVFASEMKSLLVYHIPKAMQWESLALYLQLNYLPGPQTMLEGVFKLKPGHYLLVDHQGVKEFEYYALPEPEQETSLDYGAQKRELTGLVEKAVVKRLVSDVPLGAFLSGGLDSSVIVAMARKHLDELHTFSIGYQDQPYFDETKYAQLVARKFSTKHTVFSLTQSELFQNLQQVWDHMDEPFGDSSALPTYILSKYTKRSITVALSGDGSDELFGGYQKHLAFFRSMEGGWFNSLAKAIAPLARSLPKSRNSALANKARQLQRFASGLKLSPPERYWLWASVATQQQALALISSEVQERISSEQLSRCVQEFTGRINNASLNEVLHADMRLVLPYDMLTKLDWMSMAHGLEVRAPFTDHDLVDFAFSLPSESKVSANRRKRVLHDSFKDILPIELYHRPKKGFEVPLLSWMRGELRGTIENDLLASSFLRNQEIFNVEAVEQLKSQLWSRDPQDAPARIWGLLVFQNWWNKYFL